MNDWSLLYAEIAQIVRNEIPELQNVDMWHSQVSSFVEPISLPSPSLFIGFKMLSCNDKGGLVQDCNTQIDFYLFYQPSTGEYLQILTKLHQVFHGRFGGNFGTMRRLAVNQEGSGVAGCLFRISFECVIEDSSAMINFENRPVGDIGIELTKVEKTAPVDDNPLYVVDTL